MKVFKDLFPGKELVISENKEETEVGISLLFGSETNRCKRKILFITENWRCDVSPYDFLISHFDADFVYGKKNLYLPLFPIYFPPHILEKKPEVTAEKRKFCCFIVSNPHQPMRGDFFHFVSEYMKVDSGGKYLNNIGGQIPGTHSEKDIIDFISGYNFCICFENSSCPGYCTEKIAQCMAAGTIPVYWGDPDVCNYFNEKSFLRVKSHEDFQSVREKMKELQENLDLYREMYKENWVRSETVEKFSDKEIASFGEKILSYKR